MHAPLVVVQDDLALMEENVSVGAHTFDAISRKCDFDGPRNSYGILMAPVVHRYLCASVVRMERGAVHTCNTGSTRMDGWTQGHTHIHAHIVPHTHPPPPPTNTHTSTHTYMQLRIRYSRILCSLQCKQWYNLTTSHALHHRVISTSCIIIFRLERKLCCFLQKMDWLKVCVTLEVFWLKMVHIYVI